MYNPGIDEIKAREVWKSSGGDARQTLKAFPSNRNIMIRERDLMKGLLRYNDPLEALRCIPHNVRMFYIHGYQVSSYNCALLPQHLSIILTQNQSHLDYSVVCLEQNSN